MFTLVVDDFGMRYTSKSDIDKLLAALKQAYICMTDWAGER
jgi:hypothetical protein